MHERRQGGGDHLASRIGECAESRYGRGVLVRAVLVEERDDDRHAEANRRRTAGHDVLQRVNDVAIKRSANGFGDVEDAKSERERDDTPECRDVHAVPRERIYLWGLQLWTVALPQVGNRRAS